VLVGPFADRSAAEATCGRLKAVGGACFLAPGETAAPEPSQKSVEATRPSDRATALPPWIVAAAADQKGSAAAQTKPAQAKEVPSSPSPSPGASSASRPPSAAAQAEFARVLGLAEKGDAAAELQLAGLYRAGRGVARDEAAAIRWYRAAAEKGLPEAQFELGKIYDTGVGGPRDPFEAVRWYRLSAQQGYGRAQYNLGSMHGNGEGVPVDYLKAYMWFSISEATLAPGERETARACRRGLEAGGTSCGTRSALTRSHGNEDWTDGRRVSRDGGRDRGTLCNELARLHGIFGPGDHPAE